MQRLVILTTAGLLALLATAGSARADLWDSLHRSRPRLYLHASDIARLQQHVQNDPLCRQWRQALKAEAETILSVPPVAYQAGSLLEQTRLAFDRISLLAGLYRLDGDDRFARRAVQEMLAAAEFVDWNPSHFLSTAEMTHAMAIGYDWLYERLSPAQRRQISEAIAEKGLKPGRKDYAKNSGWPRRTNNWNQVCNAGLTIGAIAVAEEYPELAREIVESGRRSILHAMHGFAPDGGWAEGPMYWNYATRYTVWYLAALQSAFGDDFGVAQMPGFADTGNFRMHFVGSSGLPFNFGDSRQKRVPAPQMFWLARRFDRPQYAAHERPFVSERPEIFHLIWAPQALPENTAAKSNQKSAAAEIPQCALFRGIDVAFLRTSRDPGAMFVGLKGGGNRVSHCHLDLGSFVLDWQGRRWAVDLGLDSYGLPGYFGSSRWEYFRLNNRSHNTLTIDDDLQNERAHAPIVAFQACGDRRFAVVDLGGVFGERIVEARRGISISEYNGVLIQDEFTAARPVEVVWNMFTPAKIDVDGRHATLTLDEHKLYARIVSPADASFHIAPADAPQPQAQQPEIRSLSVRFEADRGPKRLAVFLSPRRPPADEVPLESLDRWIEKGGPDASGP